MESTQAAPRPTGRWILGGYLVMVAALIAYAVVSGDRRFTANGDSYPGAATSIAEIVGYFTATLASAICLGALIFVVVTAEPDDRGVLDAASFRVHLLAERLAPLWLVSALAMVLIQCANAAGVPLTRLIGGGGIGSALGASEMARGWVVVAAVAAIVTVGLRLTLRWVWHAVLVIPTLIGVIALPVSGNAGQGPDHDYGTSAVIVFAFALAVLAGVKVSAAIAPPKAQLRRRVRMIEVAAGGVALLYGAALLVLLATPAGVAGSDYGRLGLLAGVALLGSMLVKRAAVASSAAIVAVAAVSAMAVQTAPRLLAHRFTAWDVFLGYQLPDPPNVLRLLTVWRFDVLIGIAALVLAGAYAVGVIRLRRRGDSWPPGRLVAWLFGCAALLFTTGSGVRAYGSAMFSVHMGEHMALNMFIPVFLVLGAPITLALRALPTAGAGNPPGPREWLLWLVHSPVSRFLSHPATAFVLFVGSLYAAYFTPIFDTLVRYHWGHEFMSLHFLITGYLFFWGIIGIDPGPKRLPFIGRLGLLFAVMPFHAFFGIATMTMTSVLGDSFYRSLHLPWLSSLTDDQHLGGAIAWGSSELPIIVVVVALVVQWARQDRRTAARTDRHADAHYDDDLDAYNAMLAELAKNRR
ncbi:putative copper resistance protein D [Mycolicibacterium sp. BK556]|uniref:cytochrome c oxidase assembly protein n=1 Tax=unclassified Mycolicibacterium TaxID=2636767 RepID=UPI00160F05FE|nr:MULTISPECIES: cytochrome c oxidase assembly protein [unclassified Mycolicibacterium]MBB3604682.1 putative copper resistance protein D [Mycolicibacterium sp. BK556]MBB3634605.1 putative copper resistance protein D [Mycolicibacterium sp. BK607]